MTALGIDTSNYTTSAALSCGGEYVMNRKLLDVKRGERGIRQSDAVFIHTRELPGIIEELMSDKFMTETGGRIGAVGVSTRPRSVEGSYMPVFTVGYGFARAIAAALRVPLFEFSHQDGHIMAGVMSSGAEELLEGAFISVHISGGTTEILRTEYNGHGFDCAIAGGTLDISAGQLIDRVGVAMGMKFPCGAELERLAAEAPDEKRERLPISVKGAYMNLSGVETKLLRSIDGPDAGTAKAVLEYLGEVLTRAINAAAEAEGLGRVLIAGGVASNGLIRGILEKNIKVKGIKTEVYFASRELSSDNAAGIAELARRARAAE